MMRKFIVNDDCCSDTPGNGDGPKDCLEKWIEEHKEVCNTYNTISAETAKHKEAYDNSLNWESKLENWCVLIEEADEKAKDVVLHLDFLLEQLDSVCKKCDCTVEVLEQLACLVKIIFDCLYTYEESNKGLKDKILDLKKAVECLKKLEEKDKEEILACIETFEAQIKAICDTQESVLTKLLETLKCATLLCKYIGGEGGLKDKLEGIRDDFNGTVPTGEDDDCDPEEEGENGNKYPCDDKAAKPIPEFPIITDEESKQGNPYYEKVKADFAIAEDKTKALKEQWIESKKKSDKELAKKNSLSEAIEAAEAAKNK